MRWGWIHEPVRNRFYTSGRLMSRIARSGEELVIDDVMLKYGFYPDFKYKRLYLFTILPTIVDLDATKILSANPEYQRGVVTRVTDWADRELLRLYQNEGFAIIDRIKGQEVGFSQIKGLKNMWRSGDNILYLTDRLYRVQMK